MIELFIPGLVTKTPNGSHGHWTTRHGRTKRERQLAKTALLYHTKLRGLGGPPGSYRVTLTRCAPRMLDDDNLATSFKSVRDGVADWFGTDDRNPQLAWCVTQEKAKKHESGTRIRIEGRGEDSQKNLRTAESRKREVG